MEAANYGDEHRLTQEMLGHYGGPAFIRRAKKLEETYQAVIDRLERLRVENREMVRLRLGQVAALAGAWERLDAFVAPAVVAALRLLHDELQPCLRLPLQRTETPRILRAALEELGAAIAQFNARWLRALRALDLSEVNTARDLYNRYYLLERECALGASRASRERFRPLPALTLADVEALFPVLPVFTVH